MYAAKAMSIKTVNWRDEVRRANTLCRKEEQEISDAETLDSESESESSDEEYESDFIDDSACKQRIVDMKWLEESPTHAVGWIAYRPRVLRSM